MYRIYLNMSRGVLALTDEVFLHYELKEFLAAGNDATLTYLDSAQSQVLA